VVKGQGLLNEGMNEAVRDIIEEKGSMEKGDGEEREARKKKKKERTGTRSSFRVVGISRSGGRGLSASAHH
jgi:hypothetical protein